MVDRSRLTDLESLLDLLYEKLGNFERELIINNSAPVQFELKQRIKHEIMPSIRRYETEYWELYPQDEIVISEEVATSQLVKVERAVNAIELIPATTYPPELIPLLQDLQAKLAEPDRIASAKLKVALPLIPAIASYEFELATEGLMSQAWKSIKGLVRRQFEITEPPPPTPTPKSSDRIFTFDTAKIEINGSRVNIIKTQKQAEYIEFDLYAGGKLELVYIPSGRFLMGQTATETRALTVEVGEEIYQTYYARELPQHLVDVSAFYMSKYPITQSQYLVVMGSNPGYFEGARFPVGNVSWHDAQGFCQQLSQKTGTKIGLPSEAQWEYACRAETHTPFHFGETITKNLGNYTYGELLKGKDRGQAIPVGFYQVANDFGLYDMHGNVWEWCLDRYHENYQNAPQDGGAWVDKNDSDSRILRGGSWDNLPRDCRSAFGFGITPDYRYKTFGFRVVCEIPRAL